MEKDKIYKYFSNPRGNETLAVSAENIAYGILMKIVRKSYLQLISYPINILRNCEWGVLCEAERI